MARTATNPGDHDASGTIPVDVAAKLLMVTLEWVRRLTKDGWISKTDRGRYRVVDVAQGYIRFLKDEARRCRGASRQAGAADRARSEVGRRHRSALAGGTVRLVSPGQEL